MIEMPTYEASGCWADRSPSQPVPNVVTIIDASVDPDEVPSMVLVHASIEIVGDASAFIRGDSNGDNLLELADAQKTLNVLFLGGDELPCEDAADTNDDGELTIVDPIRLLNFLFIGAAPPALPYPEPGLDPPADRPLCAPGQLRDWPRRPFSVRCTSW